MVHAKILSFTARLAYSTNRTLTSLFLESCVIFFRGDPIFMKPIKHDGNELPFYETGCDLAFEVIVKAYDKFSSGNVGLTIYDDIGNRIIDPNLVVKGDVLNLEKDQSATIHFLLKNVLLKPDCYTVGLWLGIANQEDIDGVRYATSFRMEARREDVLYTQPFPGVYSCEFEYEIFKT